jgi:hypothetical protein
MDHLSEEWVKIEKMLGVPLLEDMMHHYWKDN